MASSAENQLVTNRYNRQELIDGWKQDKLRKASIAIVGSGTLADFISSSLVSLGFGNVEIYDNARVQDNSDGEFLLSLSGAKKGDSKVEALEGILSKINPLVRVRGVHTRVDSVPLVELLGQPEVIVEATNDIKSKTTVIEYTRKRKIPSVSASAGLNGGKFYIEVSKEKQEDISFERYPGEPQGVVPSEVLGGIITDEVRKIVMPLNVDDIPVRNFVYSSTSPGRFVAEGSRREQGDLSGKYALIIGAGALGNFTGIGLALVGVGQIDILDFDTVETTNLNRQLLFYDSVGNEKVKALTAKLKKINPKIKVRGLLGKLDESYKEYFKLKENRPDLILDCVDNFGTRAIANYFAVRHGIPLVSGGTNPSSGQVVAYQPGQSACLDCKLNVDKALAKERTSHSCIYASQPSVITTNQIIGGLMVAEARAVLDSQTYGDPIRKMLKYDSISPARAGLVGGDAPCNCSRPSINQWLKDVDKKTK